MSDYKSLKSYIKRLQEEISIFEARGKKEDIDRLKISYLDFSNAAKNLKSNFNQKIENQIDSLPDPELFAKSLNSVSSNNNSKGIWLNVAIYISFFTLILVGSFLNSLIGNILIYSSLFIAFTLTTWILKIKYKKHSPYLKIIKELKTVILPNIYFEIKKHDI